MPKLYFFPLVEVTVSTQSTQTLTEIFQNAARASVIPVKHTHVQNRPAEIVSVINCTCLKNHFFATHTCSFQVDEGSHLFGPWMLGNETMTGLAE